MKINLKELAVFSVLGAFMYISKMIMEFLPNVHLLATLTIAFTLVWRQKALYPITVFILLTGLFSGFAMWWVPYLYIWYVLWGVTMLLPNFKNRVIASAVYMALAAAHGFLYGVLYAPWQAFWMGLDFDAVVAWILAGLPFDLIHGVSNLLCGALIIPIAAALRRIK
jgi:energy-coupling factor transport system substrate-specific component